MSGMVGLSPVLIIKRKNTCARLLDAMHTNAHSSEIALRGVCVCLYMYDRKTVNLNHHSCIFKLIILLNLSRTFMN